MFFIQLLGPGMVFSVDDELELVNVKMGQTTKNVSYANKYAFVLKELGITNIDLSYIIPDSTDSVSVKYDIIFNPFGSTNNKSLSIDSAQSLICAVANKYNNKKIGILSSPGTFNTAVLMKPQHIDNVIVVENINTIYSAISHIRACDLLITVDTALVHIGDGLDKNMLAIFPRNNSAFNPWLPSNKDSIKVIFSDANGSEVDLNNFDMTELLLGCESLLP